MQTVSKENPAKTVEAWRTGAAADSPAGPVYSTGLYAQSEIAMTGKIITAQCGTGCSYSHTRYCC